MTEPRDGTVPERAAPRRGRGRVPRRARGFLATCAAAGLFVLAYAAIALEDGLSTDTRALVSGVVLTGAAATAALCAARTAARARGRTRTAWRLMAAAASCWAVAELVFAVGRLRADEPALPTAADALFLAGGVVAIFALGAFFPRALRAERLRTVVAALVIAGAVLFISRALVLPVIVTATLDGRWAQAVYLAYPVVDVALVSLSLLVLARVGSAARLHIGLIAAGVLGYVLADMAFALERAAQTTAPVGDVGWAAGYLLFALAALAPEATEPTEPPPGRASEHPGGMSSLVVYVPVLAAIVVTARSTPLDDGVLLGCGAAVLVLFGLRQYLIARDTTRLNTTLENRVAELQSTSSALRRLVQQNERTVQSVSEGVFGVDADGVIAFANPPAAAMLGRKVAALVGRPEHELFHVSRPDAATECPITLALRTATPTHGSDEVFVRGDGTHFPVELAVGPIVENGTVLGAVIVFRDITQRREVERMKDEFISVVSHELRTPLTAIRGSLGLMAGGAIGPLPERAERLVGLALESTERLTRLINDMLDIERIESGATTMEFTAVDAADLVRTAVDGVRSLAAEVPVALTYGPLTGRVHADDDRIVQTLTNLLGNAIKFSPPQTTITVAARQEGDVVEFAVADEGRGIPRDKLERIFERFEQVDSSDSRQKGGTGLGLSISRTIVRRHGGHIWAHSEVGRGSTFYFTLPAVLGPGDGERRTDATDRPAQQAPTTSANVAR